MAKRKYVRDSKGRFAKTSKKKRQPSGRGSRGGVHSRIVWTNVGGVGFQKRKR